MTGTHSALAPASRMSLMAAALAHAADHAADRAAADRDSTHVRGAALEPACPFGARHIARSPDPRLLSLSVRSRVSAGTSHYSSVFGVDSSYLGPSSRSALARATAVLRQLAAVCVSYLPCIQVCWLSVPCLYPPSLVRSQGSHSPPSPYEPEAISSRMWRGNDQI